MAPGEEDTMRRAARRSLKLAEAATLKLASTQAVTSARARLLSRVGRWR